VVEIKREGLEKRVRTIERAGKEGKRRRKGKGKGEGKGVH
jgi:hypothetical protein